MEAQHSHPIIFFDGVCNLCNASVQFIINHDPKGRFHFAALQSRLGEELMLKEQMPVDEYQSILLLEPDGRVFKRSTAALRIARKLSGLWPMMYLFIAIPAFIRNPIYDFIAKNRYKWFGKRESCMFPTPEIKSRFVDTQLAQPA
jgi:predicted DCC family thiol-disulfide oxidoreductase YuxK